MSVLFRRLAPASFLWLVLHELRLAVRARARNRSTIFGIIILCLYLAMGIAIGLAFSDATIVPNPIALTAVLAAAIVLTSFMTTQAMLASQRTLFESGDLDLLLSAPINPRIVLLAKLSGIAVSVALTFAALLLPMALPVALLGHPGLLGVSALLVALALVAACLGLSITLAVVRIAGPRAARTVGQIVAAILAGAIFLVSQIISQHPGTRRSGGLTLFRWFSAHHVGTGTIAGLPGRAAFGDPAAIALLLGGAILLFAGAGALFARGFFKSYQDAGVRLSPRAGRASNRAIARHFHAGLFTSIFAKEWRLLARDPALAFQVVLRIIYLAPLVFVAMNHGNGPPVAPTLALISVIGSGQVIGSLSWILLSGEDAPDLLAVAPVRKSTTERIKLATAVVMAAPLSLFLPVAIAFTTVWGALVTLVFTTIGGALAGLIELRWQKPMPRASFMRRRSESFISGILTFFVTAIFGVAAGGLVWILL